MSAVLLVDPVASDTLSWGWDDPVAALVIAAVAVKEGRDACCPAGPPPWHRRTRRRQREEVRVHSWLRLLYSHRTGLVSGSAVPALGLYLAWAG